MPEHPDLTKKRVRELRQAVAGKRVKHAFSLAIGLYRATEDMDRRIEQGQKTVEDRPEYYPYLAQLIDANNEAVAAMSDFLGMFDGPDRMVKIAEVIFDAEGMGSGNTNPGGEV